LSTLDRLTTVASSGSCEIRKARQERGSKGWAAEVVAVVREVAERQRKVEVPALLRALDADARYPGRCEVAEAEAAEERGGGVSSLLASSLSPPLSFWSPAAKGERCQ